MAVGSIDKGIDCPLNKINKKIKKTINFIYFKNNFFFPFFFFFFVEVGGGGGRGRERERELELENFIIQGL